MTYSTGDHVMQYNYLVYEWDQLYVKQMFSFYISIGEIILCRSPITETKCVNGDQLPNDEF